ncbi:ribonuclease HII [Candidatus Uhrbacteria bacterium]|nr:ribonuclease HII [Candidatus Uhrbacteria bacterium]
MRPPTFAYERELIASGYLPIGVDEAGCGCLAGPVVAAACALPLDSRLGLVRDSKLLSRQQRERLLEEFRRRGYRWATGMASVEEIDRLNIRQATYLAMERAVRTLLDGVNSKIETLNSKQIQSSSFENSKLEPVSNLGFSVSILPARWYALVDAWHIPGLPIPQRGIIHGDRLVKSIAAASIIAKCTRDAHMDELDRAFPDYGFRNHRGYATVAHREAIRKFGTSVNHRLTFRLTEG